MKKHENKINIVAKVLFVFGSVFMFKAYLVPAALDIPYLFKKQYPIIEGVALNSFGNSNTKDHTKYVEVESRTGQIEKLEFYSTAPIQKGDELKITYLPHLKKGAVLEHRKTNK